MALALTSALALLALAGTGGAETPRPSERPVPELSEIASAASPAPPVSPAAGAAVPAGPAPAPPERGATAAEPAPASPVRFASYEDVELFLPTPRTMIVGFHEASYRNAVRLRPWGAPLASDNPRKEAAPPRDPGPNYAVMSTRGRPTQATSAADLAVPAGTRIASPVTGTVVEVSPYQLYGRHSDLRIRIRPEARPDLLVTVLHVQGAEVAVGDRVVGGESPLAARATHFPFRSHVDAYSGGRPPHVHVELRRA